MTREQIGEISPGENKLEMGLSNLQYAKSTIRLGQIARLRACGIGDHVNLPQIVVCGDQSAGKSSVLESITSLPFPRQEGVCTKFATEIILQHSTKDQTIVATIIPEASRIDDSKTALRKYSRQLTNFNELPMVIEEVGALMGIRGFRDITEGPAFGQDVLRIEVFGPIGLHLTVVDLPGLIAVASEEQTDDDIQMVHKLVDSYLSNPRTIILAVVQANNDIANQGIIHKSRLFDRDGQRTLGIITKPDLINKGTERRIAQLASNRGTTKLKLGFFLVKNPSPTELEKDITAEQRQRDEIQYFLSARWKEQGLDMERVGIISLRSYLQNLLNQHIERELPQVRDEIRSQIQKTEQELARMGEERSTIGHLRIFVSHLAMQFHSLATSALNGTYHETDGPFFEDMHDKDHSKRLRALVHRLNTRFADYMRDKGQKMKIASCGSDEDSDDHEEVPEDCQMFVTESEMEDWVREIYEKSRGKELPGNYNHVFLSELYHIQSSRWPSLAEDHLRNIYDKIISFVRAALEHITKDDQALSEVIEITGEALKRNMQAAEAELEKLCQDEKHARQGATKDMIKNAMSEATNHDWNGKLHISNNTFDAAKLLASLQNHITVNMDQQACAEALSGLQAYYKVAMKTFVDNVCRQVIERHLLRPLPGIFGPDTVASFEDEELKRIAAEGPENVEKRKRLRELQKSLTDSLQDLRR